MSVNQSVTGARLPPPDNVAAPEDPTDFDQLVADILDNPEKLLDPGLTAEEVLEIQKRLNPYAGIAGTASGAEHKRVAACSYTNLREDYLRRLTMTSLVGYLFQMHHEWTVPPEARRWAPPVAAGGDPAHAPYAAEALVDNLEAILAIAKESQAAELLAAARKREYSDESLYLPSDAPADQKARVEDLRREASQAGAKAAGLLYAATHATHRAGLEASGRLRATAELGMGYPEVREVIAHYPLPAPPGQVEAPADLAKEIIGGFLRHWLEFDPSVHVRSGHDAKTIAAAVEKVRVGGAEVLVDTKDPGHLTLETVRAAAVRPAPGHGTAVKEILSSQAAYNAVVALLRGSDEFVEAALAAVQEPDVFAHYLFPVAAGSPARPAADVIPPQDTFHRWAYYTEVNYEELRTITEAIYPERPDLDWAIALWDVFEGTPKEVDAAFDKHCQRYQDEVPSSIKALEFGHWSLLADFKENRKKIQFYNKNTEVLKRILDRHADDKRIGAELMRNRVRQTKARNIAKDGPDAPGLKDYKRNVAERGQDIGAKGAERVIGAEEMRRLEKARGSIKAAKELELLEQLERRIGELAGLEKLRKLTEEELRELAGARADADRAREMVAVPDDAIQVDVYTTDPATGNITKGHFYTKAEAPEHVAEARRHHEAAQGVSEHPAAVASTGLPPFAPYAVEHILREGAQSPEEKRAEAVRDHDSRAAGEQ